MLCRLLQHDTLYAVARLLLEQTPHRFTMEHYSQDANIWTCLLRPLDTHSGELPRFHLLWEREGC